MKLRDWLEKECIPTATAARVLRISRATLYKIFSGTPPSIGVVYRVRRWSRGEVDLEDFLHPDEVWLGSTEIWTARDQLAEKRVGRGRRYPAPDKENIQQRSKTNQSKAKVKSSVWGPGVVAPVENE